jgi:diamine N-acetyltransferase
LFANIGEENEASIQLFTRNGFELCGVKKDWRRTLDGWKNELMFQKILDGDTTK